MERTAYNRNSVLCTYIRAHPDTWREDMKKRLIRVSEEQEPGGHRYAILNYMPGCDFHDPVVQEARGIILDLTELTVVCWPFRKFGNYGESYADVIDWSTARVQDKEDGSICKLWYDPGRKSWRWSTNACIDAAAAGLDRGTGEIRTFLDAIRHAQNYGILEERIKEGALDPACTYIFELTGPCNRVVIRYPVNLLWHTGTRNNTTGIESVTDIGIRHPAEYPLHTLEDCIRAAAALNQREEGTGGVRAVSEEDRITKEGFVVVDAAWHRIKIKSPAYVAVHRAVTSRITKAKAVDFVLSHAAMESVRSLENRVVIAYYGYRMAALELEVQRYIDYVHGLYRELNCDRKALAAVIGRDRLSSIGFRCLKSEDATAEELLFHFKTDNDRRYLLRLLPDWPQDAS